MRIIFHSLKEINLKKYNRKKSSLFNVLIIFHCLKEIKNKIEGLTKSKQYFLSYVIMRRKQQTVYDVIVTHIFSL